MQELALGIAGIGGRMGRLVAATVIDSEDCRLIAGIDPSPLLTGLDLGSLAARPAIGVAVETTPGRCLGEAAAIIDFSAPAATALLAASAADAGCALVIGTTGLDEIQRAAIDRAAQVVPIVKAANFSLCVNLLLGMVRQAAEALEESYDIEIVEMHHRAKADAPSGTALALGEAAAAGRGAALETLQAPARSGQTGPRVEGTIGIASLRGGDVVGDHSVIFAGPGERLELTHRGTDRSLFARGALVAARWVIGKPPGLYGMDAVLGLDATTR